MIMSWAAVVGKLLDLIRWLLRRKPRDDRPIGGYTPQQSPSGVFSAVQPSFLISSALGAALHSTPSLCRVLLAYCHDHGGPIDENEHLFVTVLAEQATAEAERASRHLFRAIRLTSGEKRERLIAMARCGEGTQRTVRKLPKADSIRVYYEANGVEVAVLRPVFVDAERRFLYYLSFHFCEREGDPWRSPAVQQVLNECAAEVAAHVPRIVANQEEV